LQENTRQKCRGKLLQQDIADLEKGMKILALDLCDPGFGNNFKIKARRQPPYRLLNAAT